jgi:hypothetical protein
MSSLTLRISGRTKRCSEEGQLSKAKSSSKKKTPRIPADFGPAGAASEAKGQEAESIEVRMPLDLRIDLREGKKFPLIRRRLAL